MRTLPCHSNASYTTLPCVRSAHFLLLMLIFGLQVCWWVAQRTVWLFHKLTFPGFAIRKHDFVSRRGAGATKFDRNRPVGSQIFGSPGFQSWYSQLFRTQDALLPPSVAPVLLSSWHGWCPQPGDQRQDVGKHLSRYRDLGHLEGDVATQDWRLCADLDQLLARHRSTQ